MSALILRAPLSGWSLPLAEVPDPVFGGAMLGDGVAIDPTDDLLRAPCDAVVSSIAPARHAVTLRASNGAELLLHVGIDTVTLGGDGFEALVEVGQAVRTGDPLLRFDLDRVARRAASLITPVVVINAADFRIAGRTVDVAVRAGDVLFEVQGIATAGAHDPARTDPAAAGPESAAVSRRLQVALAHGIHARPASLMARRARDFSAASEVRAHGKRADAHSAVSLMSLGARHGDEIEIVARGTDAREAVAALAALLIADEAPPAAPGAAPAPTSEAGMPADGVLPGVIAARGYAVGQAHLLVRHERAISETGAGIAFEEAELARARSAVRERLRSQAARVTGARREIMEAHLVFVDDPALEELAARSIVRGASAAAAWRQAVRAQTEPLRAVDDERLRERVDDLLDLEAQVLDALAGESPAVAPVPDGAVVIAADLLPSQLAALDASRVAGLCLAHGGPTSHVAIMAAAMGLPTLVSLGPALLTVGDGTALILDAESGVLRVDPPRGVLDDANRTVTTRRERAGAERASAAAQCRTADGVRIHVYANVGSLTEAAQAVSQGAEGCGLLRTEFLFLDRLSAPDEAEQLAMYQQIVAAFGGRPVVVRTLDIGGDKPIDYLPLPHEDNPALGLRGIRTSLRRPDLLRTQLRAILRVAPPDAWRIMLPMVIEPEEVRAVRTLLEEIAADLGHRAPVSLGVMIETPAAALLAEHICAFADFVSIGSNDLTQYTLAMDRTNPEFSARIDGLHPAVLRLIARTADAARGRGRSVAVCGSLASDPAAAKLLIGLGVQELSAVSASIPRLKSLIRRTTIDECRELARSALEAGSVAEVRTLIGAREAVE